MRGLIASVGAGVVLLCGAGLIAAAPPGPGWHDKVRVSEPTRLDWTFVLSNRSLAKPPDGWLTAYQSTEQMYELFVPKVKDRKAPLPLILYLSPSREASAGKGLARIAQARGFLYAAPHNAGNDCPSKKRVRIILDVLDDLRRQFPIDPDRTYITGFSGGGRVACAIGFALPELFGGVAPICAGGFPREEPWLRRRVTDRLSVALLTGEKDFNRGEVERLRGPFLKDVGIRTRVWTVAGLGHGIPGDKILGESIRWMEEGLSKRQALGKKYPASRIASSDSVAREDLAKSLMSEGKERLKSKETIYSGLMQLKGVLERWPDLEAAGESKKLLLEYEEKTDKPWEADDLAEQRLYLTGKARATDRYASGPLSGQYAKMRQDMLRSAIELWRQVLADSPDSPAGKEAKKRIGELEKLLSRE
jgi:dienelactone hydrolase